jgi:hypothetical protein
VAYSEYYPGLCKEGLRKTIKTVKIADVLAKVQT